MSFQRPRAVPPAADLPELPAPGELLEGRYLIQSELGRGGMGVVLAAHDETLGRDVALKLLLPEMMSSNEILERFCNEARSLARLESRHVVKVLDFNLISQPERCAGLPFMVLELLRGQDLFSYAREQGTLPPGRVVRLALQACDGLAAAHAAGIIHRDLKPENLFIAIEADGSEVLKVLDFGVARGRGARVLTGNQIGVGSPGYMAPEQVEGSRQLDARCDIWALGVVMYELLAQQPAFCGETPHSLCLQILSAPITPLTELRPDLPAALVYVVERCLERDPDRRFANVAELAEALAPLDDRSPDSEATRARRRLEAVAPIDEVIVRPTPVGTPLPRASDCELVTGIHVPAHRRGPGRRRRVVSGIVATLALAPAVALLPVVSSAPELAPARAWSAQAVGSVQRVLLEARLTWRALLNEESTPGQAPAP
jgi:serine/threonine protein kinase